MKIQKTGNSWMDVSTGRSLGSKVSLWMSPSAFVFATWIYRSHLAQLQVLYELLGMQQISFKLKNAHQQLGSLHT